MTEVILDNLRKEFGDTIAVDDFTLKVKDKSFISLLGPSGCGKTTMLRMIAGLTPPTKGKIFFDDKDVTDLSPRDRKIGLVFQDYAVFFTMNAFDNIAWGLKIRKMDSQEISVKVKEIAELLNISDILKTMPSQMSQSELQRVALARTFVTNPAVLLLDEPLSNLDAALRARMRAELKKLQIDTKQTVIYVTHDQIEAMSLSDEVAVMNLGRLQQYNTPDNIYNNPVNKFVAGFIGSPPINFIECSIVDKGSKTYLEQEAFRLEITNLKKSLKEGMTDSEAILGIRPEDVEIINTKSKDCIECSVYAYEPVGSESIVDVTVGGTIIRIVAPETYFAKAGENAYIKFDTDKLHIIDKKTERVVT